MQTTVDNVTVEWVLHPPTRGLLGGSWGDYQRALYPQYYRKDGKLKWWAKKRLNAFHRERLKALKRKP